MCNALFENDGNFQSLIYLKAVVHTISSFTVNWIEMLEGCCWMCDLGLTGFFYYWAPALPTAQYKILSTLDHTFEDIPLVFK